MEEVTNNYWILPNGIEEDGMTTHICPSCGAVHCLMGIKYYPCISKCCPCCGKEMKYAEVYDVEMG